MLSCSDSVGDGFQWVVPEGLQTLSCGDLKKDLGFAVAKSGVYEFLLVAADKDAAIDVARHRVKITGSLPTDPGTPEPEPVDPEPTPVPELDKVKALSSELSQRLNDPKTAAALKSNIEKEDQRIQSLCKSGQCPTYQETVALMKTAISDAFLFRSNFSSDWRAGWRDPINEKIKQLNPADAPTYLAIIRAASEGL